MIATSWPLTLSKILALRMTTVEPPANLLLLTLRSLILLLLPLQPNRKNSHNLELRISDDVR